MTDTKTLTPSLQNAHYVSEFERLFSRVKLDSPNWVNIIRTQGLHDFNRLGFPTTRDEEWRFTNIAPIAKIPFRLPKHGIPAAVDRKAIDALRLGSGFSEAIFINGTFSPELSSFGQLESGIRVTGLCEAIEESPAMLKTVLIPISEPADGLYALNDALLYDGAFIHIPDKVTLNNPIHLLFITTAEDEPLLNSPRNVMIIGAQVTATIIETHATSGRSRHFSNVVSQLVIGEASRVEHVKIQAEDAASFRTETMQVAQERNSYYSCLTVTRGGQITRNTLNVVLDGSGAECLLNGLYLAGNNQHIDNHTAIDHARPHCSSHELYKGVLSGKSSGVFNGKIVVRKDAQGTDARQVNKNLLLSEGTHVNTKPQLEILADDVKCSHGATIGQLDQDAIFYLKTRGINDEIARQLLTYGFAREMIDGVANPAISQRLDTLLAEKLREQIMEAL